MLKRFVSRNQKDWDQYLPYLLSAYCEVPQETTGFSPFELLYGRQVRGPLDVLREEWTGDRGTAVPVATHVRTVWQRWHSWYPNMQPRVSRSRRNIMIEEQNPTALKLGIRY